MVAGARTVDARRLSKLLVGPWLHGPVGVPAPGDVDFGPDAWMDFNAEQVRWNDRRLKGIDNGIDDEPPVRIFVMGENVWRSENEWPLARTQYTNYYLHGGGAANTLNGDGVLSTEPPADEPPDNYTYDPDDPVWTHGGQIMAIDKTVAGPQDRRAPEQRADVLVYTTEPLERDVEVTGPVWLKLFASSSAPDTDFTGTLVDVHPDGRAINITEGLLGVRYRDSIEETSLITRPGLRAEGRNLGDEQRVQGRPPHPAGGVEQQLPAVRAQPEHRQPPRLRRRDAEGRPDDPPRRRPPVPPHPAIIPR